MTMLQHATQSLTGSETSYRKTWEHQAPNLSRTDFELGIDQCQSTDNVECATPQCAAWRLTFWASTISLARLSALAWAAREAACSMAVTASAEAGPWFAGRTAAVLPVPSNVTSPGSPASRAVLLLVHCSSTPAHHKLDSQQVCKP